MSTATKLVLFGLGLLVGGLWLVVPTWLIERRKYERLGLFDIESRQIPWAAPLARVMVLCSPVLILWGALLWVTG